MSINPSEKPDWLGLAVTVLEMGYRHGESGERAWTRYKILADLGRARIINGMKNGHIAQLRLIYGAAYRTARFNATIKEDRRRREASERRCSEEEDSNGS